MSTTPTATNDAVVPAANDATPMTRSTKKSTKKCIPAMCIDPIIKGVLESLPAEDCFNAIQAFLVNEEIPKQRLLDLLLKHQWGLSKEEALVYALMQGHIDIVECLLDDGKTIRRCRVWDHHAGHVYQTLLSIAIKHGHLDLVKHLVEKRGASMDSTFEDATFEDRGNMTPLMYAVCNDRLDIVQYLVEKKGVNIDTSFKVKYDYEDEYGRYYYHHKISTALIHAVKNEHLHIVQYLVEKGAKINDDAFSYINPVVFAAHLNNTEIVKYLVENGADFISWEGNREYDTPVKSALKHNNLDMVECIVEKKIIPKDKWENILYRACYNGFQNHEIMRYLYDKGVGMDEDDFNKLIRQTNDDFLNQGM